MTIKLNFTDGVPLHETSDGNVRVIGSRVTLHTLVGCFEMGETTEDILGLVPQSSSRGGVLVRQV